MDWNAIVSGALAGGAIGAIASLLAPWSHWGVEKKRNNRSRKYKILDEVYTLVGKSQKNRNVDILSDPAYVNIREYLNNQVIKDLEDASTIHITHGVAGISSDHDSQLLLGELVRLKKKWKL